MQHSTTEGRMKQPCAKDCPDRTATCHGTCPKWAEWEAYKEKLYDERIQKRIINQATEGKERSIRANRKKIMHAHGRA